MEKQFALTYNGQQVQQQDFAVLGESGLTDDYVLAELFRMAPKDSAVSKGVLPYGTVGTASVGPNGATGSLAVAPFRAFVGSRTLEASDAKLAWRDVRSGLSVATGDTSFFQVVPLAASTGSARWDLVYAALNIATAGDSVSRKVKDPTTGAVTTSVVTTYTTSSVTVGVQTGANDGSWGSLPSDSSNTFYIALAYVYVPAAGFNSTSTVSTKNIAYVAPVMRLARSTGAMTVTTATCMQDASHRSNWPSRASFMPSSLTGGETLVFDTHSAVLTSGVYVVDTRDWRNRFCRFSMYAARVDSYGGFGTGGDFYWNNGSSYPNGTEYKTSGSAGNKVAHGLSCTGTPPSDGDPIVANITLTSAAVNDGDGGRIAVRCSLADGSLYVDDYGTGSLTMTNVFCWLEFTSPFENLQ